MPNEISAAARQKISLYDGLFDTGASATCISDKVIAEQNLESVGKVAMTSASGRDMVNIYRAQVGFPLTVARKETGKVGGELRCFADIYAGHFHNADCGFDVLIGRDIICRGVFNLTFDGHFTFAF